MKKIIKYFSMFLLILTIVISTSHFSLNAEEPETNDVDVEEFIDRNSPLTEEQKAMIKQYLSEYVDENVVQTIVTVISALAILAILTFSLIKLVKNVNGGLKLKTQETSTFNNLAQTAIEKLGSTDLKLEATIKSLSNSLEKQLEVNAEVIKQNLLQNEKLELLENKLNELQEKEIQRIEKASEIATKLNEKINKIEV